MLPPPCALRLALYYVRVHLASVLTGEPLSGRWPRQVLKHLGEVEIMQQVLEKSVAQMKDLKLRLLKSAAAEACMQVTNSTYQRHGERPSYPVPHTMYNI